MKKETCSQTSRFGIPAATCGTRLRDKIWLPEKRIKESKDGETTEDGAHSGWSSDGTRGWLGFRTNEKRVVRFHECGEHWTRSDSSVCTGREVRCGSIPVFRPRVGCGGRKIGGAEFLRNLSQHALHHHAATPARGNLGSRSRQNDEGLWRSHSGGDGQENHGLPSGTLRAGESEGVASRPKREGRAEGRPYTSETQIKRGTIYRAPTQLT